MTKLDIAAFYDRQAPRRDEWRRRSAYYHEHVARICREIVPPGATVLEVGCSTGELLAAVQPGYGVGVDLSLATVRLARSKFPHLKFVGGDVEALGVRGPFDYILLSDVLGSLTDVQVALEELRRVAHEGTRLVLTYQNFRWEPLLKWAEGVGLKMPELHQNWIPLTLLEEMLRYAGWQPEQWGRTLPCPQPIPLLAPLLNGPLAQAPPVSWMYFMNHLVAQARPMGTAQRPFPTMTCSVVIPCHNEEANIRECIARVPAMGAEREIIVVDDGSTDRTAAEVTAIMQQRPDVRLISYPQNRGKGHAVRTGFDEARGDVVMILDADMTVPPETLPRFFAPIAVGQADFVNGTRLVYPMEQEAMRFLNLAGNKLFGILFSWLLRCPLTDTLCGTKALRRRDYRRIEMGRDHWGDFDLLFGAAKLGLRISEVPVHYGRREAGASKMRFFRHGGLMVRMFLRGVWELKWRARGNVIRDP